MRLRNAWDGVFVRVTPDALRVLECLEPYVVYGTLREGSITELLTRRGYGKVVDSENTEKPERVALDNVVIEDALGSETGCICVSDVVSEIMAPGPNFKAVNNFLWPFRLADVDSGFEKRKLKKISNKKEDYGDKGEGMEDILKLIM